MKRTERELFLDLHLHSRYSRAVSSQMVPGEMALWAAKKGIDVLGSGDFTHPLWLRQLESELEESGEGVYCRRGGEKKEKTVNFLLSGELSCIYSQGGRSRRIHLLVLVPNFTTAYKVNRELERRGFNLASDGRPILGIAVKDLAVILKEVDENISLIPAHIWTPWYSLYGSFSGFGSLEECFGQASPVVKAVETGLSSDPAMNWQIEDLAGRQIVSFSDAHSPTKLGREMTVVSLPKGELSFRKIVDALEGEGKINFTVEFYPEEGKYHFSGHRICKICRSPEEISQLGRTCPVCGRPLTLGVAQRVEELKRKGSSFGGEKPEEIFDDFGVCWQKISSRPPYLSLVPLLEILAQIRNVGLSSKKVINDYNNLTVLLGAEREIMLRRKPEEIERAGGVKLKEAVLRVRGGKILIKPGFDGQFGEVKIWGGEEERRKEAQISLF